MYKLLVSITMKTNYKNSIVIISILIGLVSCRDQQAYEDGQYWAEEVCKTAEFEINGGEEPIDFLVGKQFMRIKYYTDFCPPEFKDYAKGFEDYIKECEHRDYLKNQLRLVTETYERCKSEKK